jgi:hypothetical protein
MLGTAGIVNIHGRHRQHTMPNSTLILRRASASRISGSWQQEDYDVFDGDDDVGPILPYCGKQRVEDRWRSRRRKRSPLNAALKPLR